MLTFGARDAPSRHLAMRPATSVLRRLACPVLTPTCLQLRGFAPASVTTSCRQLRGFALASVTTSGAFVRLTLRCARGSPVCCNCPAPVVGCLTLDAACVQLRVGSPTFNVALHSVVIWSVRFPSALPMLPSALPTRRLPVCSRSYMRRLWRMSICELCQTRPL